VIAIIVCNAALSLIYLKVLAKRKLPDMKIVQDLAFDLTIDISAVDSPQDHEFKKVQISDEVRNCVVLKKGKPFNIGASGLESISLGVGTKDFSNYPVRLSVKGTYSSGDKVSLFSKEFNPRTYFRDRVWNDVEIQIPKKQGEEAASLSFDIESEKDINLYISLPIKTPLNKEEKKTNVYILVVDSLRSDYFESSEKMRERGHTHVAELLEESTIYPNAYTQGAWTLPTLASLLSGLYASYHDQHHPRLQKSLNERIPLLPEMLRKKGYLTYGYGTGPRTTPNYGYSRGFDRYYYKICDKEFGSATASEAFTWAKEQDRKSGYAPGQFYYLHLLEAHWPYYPPRDFEWIYNKTSKKDVLRDVKKYRKIKGALDFDDQQSDLFRDLYKAEIDYSMYEIDGFLRYLKDRGVYEDSIVVIMGDHGNNFGEHNPIATFDIYKEYLGVGLSVKYPASYKATGVDESLVSANIDIAPTVARALDLDEQSFFNGNDLLSSRESPGSALGESVISEDMYVDRYSVSIRNVDYAFLYRTHFEGTTFKNFERKNEAFELYDTKKDPEEKNNTFKEADPGIKKEFLAVLNKHITEALSYHGVDRKITIGE